MIPPSFEYTAPRSVEDAVRALAEGGEEAKVLAGGQSLMPLLRMRLAFPELVVDVGGIPELRGVREDGDTLVIGALTTHHTVLRDPLVRRHAGLLAKATATVADPAVRHRGTLGGALAHADPAGDVPTAIVALDAELVAQGPDGRRSIPAAEFFTDYLQSTLSPDELLVEVRLPKPGDGWGFHYEKFRRATQEWAVVGVAAAVRRTNGRIEEARVALTNMGPTPVRARATEAALAGADVAGDAIARAAASAAEGTAPGTDLAASAEYRAHLARVLTRRAVTAAAG